VSTNATTAEDRPAKLGIHLRDPVSRFKAISPESATGRAKNQFEAVNARLGMVPNMMRAMANAPAVLDGYLSLSEALEKGRLSARMREQLALAVGQANQCEYCVAAHAAVGTTIGMTADPIRDSRLGTAVDSKADALIRFARKLMETRGRVTERDIEVVRAAGFDDGAIAEAVAQVALNIFTNYFNQVAGTILDFPKAPALGAGTCEATRKRNSFHECHRIAGGERYRHGCRAHNHPPGPGGWRDHFLSGSRPRGCPGAAPAARVPHLLVPVPRVDAAPGRPVSSHRPRPPGLRVHGGARTTPVPVLV
jgi:uncharacterized peroxidase-related enzyme